MAKIEFHAILEISSKLFRHMIIISKKVQSAHREEPLSPLYRGSEQVHDAKCFFIDQFLREHVENGLYTIIAIVGNGWFSEIVQGGFFYWSALKMTKCHPLKEFSELVLPKKRQRMKKVKVPKLVPLYSRNSSNTFNFLVEIY